MVAVGHKRCHRLNPERFLAHDGVIKPRFCGQSTPPASLVACLEGETAGRADFCFNFGFALGSLQGGAEVCFRRIERVANDRTECAVFAAF
jgi:hypothetical protein